MTLIDLTALQAALGLPGPLVRGEIRVTRWAGRGPAVTVEGAVVTFPVAVCVDIRDGVASQALDLPPSGARFCYRLEVVDMSTGRAVSRHVAVPDAESIPFGDLPIVDPTTLEPSEDTVAAWTLVVDRAESAADRAEAAAEGVQDVSDEVEEARQAAASAVASAEAAESSAASAQASAADAAADASAASTSADEADTAAGRAESAAASAVSHAQTASTAADVAAGAASDAAGSADTASSSASVAVSSASAAGGSADAAASSAGEAAGSASAASSSASSASSSAGDAADAADRAELARAGMLTGGTVEDGDLILTTVDGEEIPAGRVQGEPGRDGLNGDPTVATSTAPLTSGASGGTITLTRGNGAVTAVLAGVVKSGTVEHIATIPEGFAPAFPQGHGFLVDPAGEWWPCKATSTQILVLGPPPAGTVLNGSMYWSAT